MDNLGELGKKSMMPAASSEATKIEQARAFGEVAIQAELAKRFPREMSVVFQRIDETFELSPALIAASKYEYPRGNARVVGYSIQFARAVASCVGNIHYSVKELSREKDQTEMLCYAWDLETNSMQTRSFIVKHNRYASNKNEKLTKERDIYENNSNVGGRRVRECLLGVLPASAVKHAERKVEEMLKMAFPPEKQQAYATANIERFGSIGVSLEELVKNRNNRPPETWTKNDLSALANYWDSIEKGISTVDEVFREQGYKHLIQDLQNGQSLKDKLSGKPEGKEKESAEKSKLAEEKSEENATQTWAEKLAAIVELPEYKPAVQSLLKNEEISAASLRTVDEERAKQVYDLLVKTKGFIDAEAGKSKPEETEPDYFGDQS